MNDLARWTPALLLAMALPLEALAGGVSTYSIDDVSVVEGSGSLQFTVTATPPAAVPTTISYVSSNGTAQSGSDYTAVAGTLSFGVGVATQTITVDVSGDVIVEADETVNITLSNPSGGSTLSDALGVGTIQNDDTTTVSVADSEVFEGGAGGVPMDFAVSFSQPVQGAVSLAFQTADGDDADPSLNATAADGDYVAANGIIGFSSLATGPQPFSVTVLGDGKVEPDQVFRVNLGIGSLPAGVDPADVILPAGAVLGRIRDDDGTVINLGDVAVDEGNGGAVTLDFPITLSNPSKTPVSVNYTATAGSAQAADFKPVNGVFVIPPLTTATTIPVPVLGESIVEPDETVLLTLSAPSGGFLGDGSGVGTIRNDDSAVLVAANTSVAEGNAGTTPMSFTVTLSNPVQGAVSASASSADGANADPLLNATVADNDYQAITSPLSFPAGTTTQTVIVPIVGDTDVAADQQLRLLLSNLAVAAGLPAGSVTLAPGAGLGTIQNDDSATLSIADASVAEGNAGNTPLVFTVSLSGPSEAAVTVGYQVAGQTATAGADFVAASGTLTIPAGATTASLTVSVIADTLVEGNETLQVQLSNAQGAALGDALAVGTIVDDDVARLRLSDASGSEIGSGSVVFTATLSAPLAQPVTVQYATGNGTASAGTDYAETTGQITFAPGVTSATIVVPLMNDGLAEGDETFMLTLFDPVPGPPLVVLDDATGSAVILDDETVQPIPAGGRFAWWLAIAGMLLLGWRARVR